MMEKSNQTSHKHHNMNKNNHHHLPEFVRRKDTIMKTTQELKELLYKNKTVADQKPMLSAKVTRLS